MKGPFRSFNDRKGPFMAVRLGRGERGLVVRDEIPGDARGADIVLTKHGMRAIVGRRTGAPALHRPVEPGELRMLAEVAERVLARD